MTIVSRGASVCPGSETVILLRGDITHTEVRTGGDHKKRKIYRLTVSCFGAQTEEAGAEERKIII